MVQYQIFNWRVMGALVSNYWGLIVFHRLAFIMHCSVLYRIIIQVFMTLILLKLYMYISKNVYFY